MRIAACGLTYAIIATEDRVNNLEFAQRMAKRAESHVTLIKASHFVQISRPCAVAQVIEKISDLLNLPT